MYIFCNVYIQFYFICTKRRKKTQLKNRIQCFGRRSKIEYDAVNIICSHKLLINLCLRFREQGDILFTIKLVYFSFSYIACTERKQKIKQITCTLYYTFNNILMISFK